MHRLKNKLYTKILLGPGTYDLGSTKSRIKWSFRSRVLNNDPMHSGTEKNPGAGTYEVPSSLSKTGKYFLSKFSSSCAKVFDPPRSKRFPETSKSNHWAYIFLTITLHSSPDKAIGPGQYDIPGIKPDGKYFVSTQKNSKCRTFSHDQRRTLSIGTFRNYPSSLNNSKDFIDINLKLRTKFLFFYQNFLVQSPGPGSYRLPSEFGYYESARASTQSLH